MRKTARVALMTVGAVALVWLTGVFAAEKVMICHTGNGKHYTSINVDDDSNQIKGHCNHAFDCRGPFDKKAIDLCATMLPCPAANSCPSEPVSAAQH